MSDFLASLEGEWSGTATTWFEPGPGFQDPWNVTYRVMPGAGLALQDYTMSVQGSPHQGWALIAREDSGRYTVAWADSFHTGGNSIMTSTGTVDADGRVSVLGSYEAGPDERWGWRTELQLQGAELTLLAFNITPQGDEYPAIEVRLQKRPG
jgi:hypothetical protein